MCSCMSPSTPIVIPHPPSCCAKVSAAEVDKEILHNKDFESAMGEDGMKRFAELSAAAIECSENNLFAFDPAMSYVSPEWIKADPEFWTPKATKVAMTSKQRVKTAVAQSKLPQ